MNAAPLPPTFARRNAVWSWLRGTPHHLPLAYEGPKRGTSSISNRPHHAFALGSTLEIGSRGPNGLAHVPGTANPKPYIALLDVHIHGFLNLRMLVG